MQSVVMSLKEIFKEEITFHLQGYHEKVVFLHVNGLIHTYEHLYTYRREEFGKIFEKINCAIALDS